MLSHHNISPKGTVHRNLSPRTLHKKTLATKGARRSKSGVAVVYTGKYTGRSPFDRFIVDSKGVHAEVNWGKVNIPIKEQYFESLYKRVSEYLSERDELFIFDGFAGADEKYKLHVRVVAEHAYQALFMNHLLRRPTKDELDRHIAELTILAVPGLKADPKRDGTNSEAFIILNMERMLVLIGGTKYCGELKKSVFTVMNYLLPARGVFPMHCSANMGRDGTTALFFGLSGTGKTTLSADPERFLIGDDEHGWSENGIFNFEGGCYAKCINLKRESEPQIWDAVRDEALVENVVLKDGELDFSDSRFTQNTRVAYPLEYIEDAVLSGVGDHPRHIIFLTADAFGVMPPVARLNIDALMYHFLSGYTSKVAGTERGITTPKATFSTCFGAPFMPLNPLIYAKLLKRYISKYKSTVYLVNTGWTGGVYGVGERISIKDTRAIVRAILNGWLDTVRCRHDDLFNLDVPESVSGVDASLLKPRDRWKDKKKYDETAAKLVSLFVANFENFEKVPRSVVAAGPSF